MANQLNLSQRYVRVFVEVFQLSEDFFGPKFTFASVPGWDSVIHIHLITALEEEFEVMLETEEILHFGSFENGKHILAKHGVAIEGD